MACYHPLTAYQVADGSVVFAERGDVIRTLSLPCGQCIGCRLERSRQWAVRCVHEASLHAENCLVTLTYNEANVPQNGSLVYRDFQLFMKRLRQAIAPVRPRFFMCGEYGEENERPHFHACIFGYRFPDAYYWRRSGAGSRLSRSPMLEALWRLGTSEIGEVNFESAAYVARYCLKKVTGDPARDHYAVVDKDTGEVSWREPEFVHMSLKPGIGRGWLDKFSSDVYPHDYVVIRGGRKVMPPKYYDRQMDKLAPDMMDELRAQRELDAVAFVGDRTEERLAVREQVARAASSAFKRKL